MQWEGNRESENVEDRRDDSGSGGGGGLLKRGQGQVVPESFTHGTSAQRTHWFNTGLQNGSVKGCDTFGAQTL